MRDYPELFNEILFGFQMRFAEQIKRIETVMIVKEEKYRYVP